MLRNKLSQFRMFFPSLIQFTHNRFKWLHWLRYSVSNSTKKLPRNNNASVILACKTLLRKIKYISFHLQVQDSYSNKNLPSTLNAKCIKDHPRTHLNLIGTHHIFHSHPFKTRMLYLTSKSSQLLLSMKNT